MSVSNSLQLPQTKGLKLQTTPKDMNSLQAELFPATFKVKYQTDKMRENNYFYASQELQIQGMVAFKENIKFNDHLVMISNFLTSFFAEIFYKVPY